MRRKESAATSAKPNENSINNTATLEEAPEAAQSKKEDEDEHEINEEDDDEDSAEEVEKVEHYLESPEKEHATQKTPPTETEVQKQENQPESYTAVCNLQLKNNKEIENNIMEEKIIEVINAFPCSL